ncbi:hypothetical protein [Pseudonocardia sp. GCM10023141]|uniref:hypothetical protein n=1 Tax=Pseudonocardia sp. GCM10023141 TaxID=3252653 RepID=UPI0036141261
MADPAGHPTEPDGYPPPVYQQPPPQYGPWPTTHRPPPMPESQRGAAVWPWVVGAVLLTVLVGVVLIGATTERTPPSPVERPASTTAPALPRP